MNSDEDLSESENGGVPLSHHPQATYTFAALPHPAPPGDSVGSTAGTASSNHTLHPNAVLSQSTPGASPLSSDVAGSNDSEVIAPSPFYTQYPAHHGWAPPQAGAAAGNHADIMAQGEFYFPLPPQNELIAPPPPPFQGDGFDLWGNTGPPISFGNPQSNSLAPDNPGLAQFLRFWAATAARLRPVGRMKAPWLPRVNEELSKRCVRVQLPQLCGDEHDFQGLNWASMGISRVDARERRLLTYKNYTNRSGSDDYHVSFPC